MLKHVLLVGASGLTGGLLLQRLLADPAIERVTALVRRPLDIGHPKLEQHVLDFEQLDQHKALIHADAVFCCLGTTIRQAGSQARFKSVDYFYPLMLGMIAKINQVPCFVIISALGADSQSGNFYLQTKGQLDNALTALHFESLTILRPSLLTGERKQFRLGERIGLLLARLASVLLVGRLARYRPISAQAVAWNMLDAARTSKPGVSTLESDELAARFRGHGE